MAFNLQSIKDVFSKIGAGIQKLPEQANRDWLQGGLVQNNPLIPNVAKPIIKPVVQVGPAPFIANYAKAAGSLVDPNQNLIQRAGNVAGAVYQNVHPFQTMAGGLMGVPFNYAANAIQNTIAGKPINQNFNPISAYQQGFEFQSKLGPAEKLVSPVTGPILNGLIKSDKYLPQILKAGFKGGIPMSIVGFAEPAKNMQEAFGNALSSFAQGFVFSGVTKGVEIPATKIWNNVKASIRMSKPNASEQEITREGVRYIMTESGKLAGSRPKTKEPEFYGDVRERLGLPRTGIEPPQVGMTTKEVTPEQRAKLKIQNEEQRLNVNKLNLPNEQRLNVREAENALNTPKTTMTNESVLEKAKSTVGAQSAVQMEDTLAKAAKSHATMQNVVDLQNKFDQLKTSGASDAELKQAFRALGEKAHVARSIRTEHGRLLQADKIMADAASTPMQKVMSLLDNAGVDLKKVEDDAIKVNWDNANEVVKFYRKFVKPSFREVLDEYRYNNMLSGLGTQIRNNYSNLIQTIFTRPATKLVSGDVKGTVKYYQGLAKSLSDAGKAASKSFKGMESSQKLDFKQMKTGKLPKIMTWPSDAMEAADKFWMTLIKGGETNAGKTSQQAEQIAKYSLFRNELDPKNKSGQGDLLSGLDALTARVSELRNPIKIGKREYPNPVGWFVPFIKTGTQIGKQWLEFTPGAGMATLPGNTNKKEQLAKQLIGLVPMIIGADLAMQGRTTWQAPTDPKQKEEFYASGRKPMSIRMGDTWVPMEYFGPLAVALALPAAHNYYFNEAPDAITSGTDAKIAKTLMAGMQLYTQQSWMSGLGNFINLARGDVQDYSIPQNLAFTAGQFKPYSGLMASVARLVDPIYRKAQGFGQAFIRDIPLASRSLPAYTNPAGEESTRLFRNNILPYQVGKVDETFERGYQNRSQQLQYNRIVTRSENVKDEIKALLKQGKTEEANALIKKNMDILKQGAVTGNIKKRVDKYQGYRKKVIDSPLPPAKKKELLNLIDKQLATLLKQTESLVIPTNKI